MKEIISTAVVLHGINGANDLSSRAIPTRHFYFFLLFYIFLHDINFVIGPSNVLKCFIFFLPPVFFQSKSQRLIIRKRVIKKIQK